MAATEPSFLMLLSQNQRNHFTTDIIPESFLTITYNINMIRAQDKNLAIAATTNDDDYSSLERIVSTDIKLGSITQTTRTRSISSGPGAATRRRVSEVSAASIESALSALSSKTARSIYDEEEMDLGAMLKELSI
ncbi:predicted protein [Chaetoceros tenuissimus]|uniref:Uncharacterized protein n=1 Tax=Chaetoceros tenuissimus TaxID=426638 RepID=A0AAD3D7G9_9STRA|nr:predicted protein [Chaetoceros tenuissimus]